MPVALSIAMIASVSAAPATLPSTPVTIPSRRNWRRTSRAHADRAQRADLARAFGNGHEHGVERGQKHHDDQHRAEKTEDAEVQDAHLRIELRQLVPATHGELRELLFGRIQQARAGVALLAGLVEQHADARYGIRCIQQRLRRRHGGREIAIIQGTHRNVCNADHFDVDRVERAGRRCCHESEGIADVRPQRARQSGAQHGAMLGAFQPAAAADGGGNIRAEFLGLRVHAKTEKRHGRASGAGQSEELRARHHRAHGRIALEDCHQPRRVGDCVLRRLRR